MEKKFVLRTYTAADALPTTKKVEIIDKKEFAVAARNPDDKTFVVHVGTLAKPTIMPIYFSSRAQVVSLTSKKTGIFAEYSYFSNVFSSDSAVELPEYTKINDHPINQLNNKQPRHGSIYNL